MNLYKVHGLLQFIAFFILFPVRAIVAGLRERIGASWRTIHVSTQLLATLLVFAAVSIVHMGNKKIVQS